MKMLEFNRQPYPTALLVIGVPGQGLVGSIAANYLIETQEMNLVGTLVDDSFPPSVSVVDGVGVSPVQLWAGAERCGLDGDCEQLLVIKSDMMLPPECLPHCAEAVMRWAKDKGVRLVVSLEGVSSQEAPADFVNVVGLVSPTARHLLGRKEFEMMGTGVVSGHTAALLNKSAEHGVPVLGLYTSARVDVPDAAAAAKLLEALNPLLPAVPIDAAPLREQANQIEARIRAAMKTQKDEMARLQEPASAMYA